MPLGFQGPAHTPHPEAPFPSPGSGRPSVLAGALTVRCRALHRDVLAALFLQLAELSPRVAELSLQLASSQGRTSLDLALGPWAELKVHLRRDIHPINAG